MSGTLISQDNITQLLTTLPKPYAVMRPGDIIYPGCLMGDPATGEWVLTTQPHWESVVEGTWVHYAAPSCPRGFSPARSDTIVADNALVWRKIAPYWADIPAAWKGLSVPNLWHDYPRHSAKHVRHIAALSYLLSCDPIICNPIEDTWMTRALPERHRALFLNDVVRRGDKRINAETPEWVVAPHYAFGTQVTASVMENARFARPIPAIWKNWYIDERKGRGNNKHSGESISKACASVKGITDKLDNTLRSTGVRIYGMVWDVHGLPVYVTDMPIDAPADAVITHNTANTGAVPHTIAWLLDRLNNLGEMTTHSKLVSLSEESLPAHYRVLSAAEVAQEHDIVYTMAPGERLPLMWQPTTPRMWHQPGARYFLFARHEDSPAMLESVEIRMIQQEDRIRKLEANMNGVAEQLKKLSDLVAVVAMKSGD